MGLWARICLYWLPRPRWQRQSVSYPAHLLVILFKLAISLLAYVFSCPSSFRICNRCIYIGWRYQTSFASSQTECHERSPGWSAWCEIWKFDFKVISKLYCQNCNVLTEFFFFKGPLDGYWRNGWIEAETKTGRRVATTLPRSFRETWCGASTRAVNVRTTRMF